MSPRKTPLLLAVIVAATTIARANAFVAPTTTRRSVIPSLANANTKQSLVLSLSRASNNSSGMDSPEARTFDKLLKDETKFRQAIQHLQSNPTIDLTRERFTRVFHAIEVETSRAEENTVNTRALADYPPTSPCRMQMTAMYDLLQKLQHLQLFGAISKTTPPASGSHVVTPTLLEQVTQLSMTSLTPKATNTLLYAGVGLAICEIAMSFTFGIDLNLLVLTTLLLAFLDRLFLNGAIFESLLKVFSPGIQNKILRHEAGHFLCAYLLGCPVEGCVLDAWAALQDARFGGRRTGVSAGTSFFDPILSQQINTSVVTRSSIDRYSIIVMGGIAAEAIHFGRADGGAGDEQALVAFLSQLNARSNKQQSASKLPAWNEQSIRNQARWGALQAVLLVRHYKPCYDALVKALERGGALGDCVYAIEEAGRNANLTPLDKPLGFIVDEGDYGTWTTTEPTSTSQEQMASTQQESQQQVQDKPPAMQNRPTQEVLQEYKEIMKDKLRDIDERLKDIES